MQAFEGFRVLDLTHVLAGPFCTYQLAVLGAEVIKVESPDNLDMVREIGVSRALNERQMGLHYLAQSANKKSLTLNLKTEAGRTILRRLVADADVLVENYRTGALDALGLGYQALSKLNPRLIHCSMTGFGHTGAKRNHTAYDNVIQAFSGLMAATGNADVNPVKVGPAVVDYGTGAQAAFAIAAALTRRERTGKGQHLDISMLDAAIVLMSQTVMQTQASGEPPVPHGNSDPENYGYGCYPTGAGLVMLGCAAAHQHVRLWRALGRADIADSLVGLSRQQVLDQSEHLAPVLREVLLGKSADAWETLLNEAAVPAARVRTLFEALASGQFDGRDVLQNCGTPPEVATEVKTPVAAFTANEDGARLHSPPPEPGQHTAEILATLSYTPEDIERFRTDGVV